MRNVLFLLFTFLLFGSFAQTSSVSLEGRCLDKKGKGIEHVWVVVNYDSLSTVFTDKTGKFNLKASPGDSLNILYYFNDNWLRQSIRVADKKRQRIPDVRFDLVQIDEVVVTGGKSDPFDLPKLPKTDFQKLPLGSVERALIYSTAATSNNELTSNYNVRGGSYDENLVYVNGFLVYRPFLTRSGQQEGMSFINSALVKDVKFSAGGFDAQYGDRLSSVLDITYATPDKFNASASGSLLGVESHLANNPTTRFNFLAAARYRSNGYLLNTLPTKGTYNPVFWDAQVLTNYAITEKLNWSILGHVSSNDYRFSPTTQKTDFGTANEAYAFTIYFEGKERTRFQTLMAGTSLNYKPTERTKLDLYATVFNTAEREYFDILGQYFINELETDPSKEAFGDSIAVLGIGSFLNHARNKLNATITSVYHNGSHQFVQHVSSDELRTNNQQLLWGVNYQYDQFTDVLSEWKLIDSAGYAVPQGSPNEVELYETIKGNLELNNQRYTAFFQWRSTWSKAKLNLPITVNVRKRVADTIQHKVYHDTIPRSSARWSLNIGTRGGYTAINKEHFITPRISLVYQPRVYMVTNDRVVRRDVALRLASGLYYQPPFYREFRTFSGGLNTQVKSQKSFHLVAGTDYFFNMWGRDVPFKLTGELFYKYLWDVNPYEIENVRTRYYANNNAVAYAYGVDVNVYGQFVEGIESFFKVCMLSTKEDILDDRYTEYYNAKGEKIIFGYSEDQNVVDSAIIFPGYVPRPTDQLFNFGALIQDKMPGFEDFTVQTGIQFGSRLPYGPPDHTRYKDTLRMRSYFRVDMGMSYDLLQKSKNQPRKWSSWCQDAILSFEVFNLLGINNVLSKQWIQDVEGKYYSIPNYLTQRRFNLKFILRF